MLERSKREIALLVLFCILSTLIPFSPALATSTTVLSRPTVDDDGNYTLGTIFKQSTAGTLKVGDTATISLPSDFKFMHESVSGSVYEISDTRLWQSRTLLFNGNMYVIQKYGIPYTGDTPALAMALLNAGYATTPGETIPGSTAALQAGAATAFIGDVLKDDGTALNQAELSTYHRNYFEYPGKYLDDVNGVVAGATLTVVTRVSENQIKIKIAGNPPAYGLDLFQYIHFGLIYVPSGFTGDITATLDAPSGSGIPTGSIAIGRVGSGEITLGAANSPTFSDNTTSDDPVKFRIDESLPGDLSDKNESIKLTLPNGFEWQDPDDHPSGITVLWGEAKAPLDIISSDDITAYDIDSSAEDSDGNVAIGDLEKYLQEHMKIDGDELALDLPTGFESTSALSFEVSVNVNVEDETKAKVGDVTAKVTGKSDPAVSELLIGKYGQYDVTISAADPPTIVSGMTNQIVAKVTVSESVKDSLTNGRTLTLTLPSSAKWGAVDTDSANGVALDFAGFPGTDGKTAKWTVSTENGSSDATDLDLSDMEVVVEPGFEGDLVAEVGGIAGLGGELTLAKVSSPVKIEADTKPVVGIGQGEQEVSDLTITEAQAGAITDDADMLLDLPEGVSFAGTPTVEVIEGDLDIDVGNVTTRENSSTDDNQLVIPIDGKSTTASTIKISGIKIKIDRSVPKGDVYVKVKGDAVGEVNNTTEVQDYFGSNLDTATHVVTMENKEAYPLNSDDQIFPNTETAAKAVIATVGTPGEVNTQVQFVIGSTSYKVNGVEKTMDVVPYLKNDRTYLPVRYVAQSLGVSDSNILWDESTQKVTLIKDDKVVQLTIGSNIMLVNGVPVTMDVPAEITSDRTMLPFRFIAQTFCAGVECDDATQTVTMTL